MNKEGFLKELESHLRVLDDKEQQDILDEYAQHIDLKMKSGLSEEEAIGFWQYWRAGGGYIGGLPCGSAI